MIYFDYAATTPVDPRVIEKMLPFLTKHFGNASSLHSYGQVAEKAVAAAREQVASLLNADPREILWTSGATESNNLAIKGAAMLYQQKGRHIITLKTEHPSVLKTCAYLEKQGFSVDYLGVRSDGLLDLETLSNTMRDDTILVSVMHVNNEIGIIQNISRIAEVVKSRGSLFHLDAAQSAGKYAIDVQKLPVDLISCCAHKVYGPKGVGALYVRRKPRVRLAAQIHGGDQEAGMRSGTLPVHQLVGMGEAFYIAEQEREADFAHMLTIRKRFLTGLAKWQPFSVNGHIDLISPGILNVCFESLQARAALERLPSLAYSSGSACHANDLSASHVLRALGLSAEAISTSVRFSFGRFNTVTEVDQVIEALKRAHR